MLNEKKFRFWCQTVLPLVYDDSLSYYELLNKVVTYLNNTIQDVQDVSDDYQEFAEAVNTQMATLTQDMTTLANTVGQFDDRITLNTNEIHILDNEMEDTLQYEGVVTTFPNPAKYGFYKVPEGHDTSFPEEHIAEKALIVNFTGFHDFYCTFLAETLEKAGTGICLANGSEKTKKAADYVTEKDVVHDGLGEFLLKKYF